MAWRQSPGRGGKVYKVTNLNASGAGSLKACVADATGPRVCVFEVSGTIRITSDMMVRNGNLTIAGQTAPSPGITIRGAALRIQANDILVQHIRVRAGDDTNGPDPDNRDSLKIEGSDSRQVKNIVIDHCTFSWAIDEIASVWGWHDNITFTNNIFAEPLNESLHMSDDGRTREKHGFGVLLGIEQERRPRHHDRQPDGAPGGAQPAGALARAGVREQPDLRPRQHGHGHADRLRPGHQELDRRQRDPARAELQPRHQAHLAAHRRLRRAGFRVARLRERHLRAGIRQLDLADRVC